MSTPRRFLGMEVLLTVGGAPAAVPEREADTRRACSFCHQAGTQENLWYHPLMIHEPSRTFKLPMGY